MNMEKEFASPAFPRSSAYNPEWIRAGVSGGANPLWLTEWLAGAMNLQPGMRVLDLGCGRAMSSIFLHREFGVQVWAVDLLFSATENLQRVQDAGAAEGVFPIHADARSLPFAAGFFDAIISIDSFVYYGTDDLYLGSLARFVKPAGLIGIAGAGLMQEIGGTIPEHLREWWTPDLWCLHSAGWWQQHWAKTGIMDVETADTMPDGWRLWLDWHLAIAPDNAPEIRALEADCGQYLGYTRMVGRRRQNVSLEEPMMSIPTQYEQKPLLRDGHNPE
jgi:SAM-dependent methyltransferase